MRYLILELGKIKIAIQVQRVAEVLRAGAFGPAPGSSYIGTIGWRGLPLSVIDPALLRSAGARVGVIAAVEVRGVPLGIPGERAIGISEIPEEKLKDPPPDSEAWITGLAGDTWLVEPDALVGRVDLGQAMCARDEREFMAWCRQALAEMAERRKSRSLKKAAEALGREMEEKA